MCCRFERTTNVLNETYLKVHRFKLLNYISSCIWFQLLTEAGQSSAGDSDNGGPGDAVIAGIVAGALILMLVLLAVLFIYMRKRRSGR